MVEIWFSILTKQQVRRGVYHDVPELIAAIETFIEGYNRRAQPFLWTKTAEDILIKAAEGRRATTHFRNAAPVPRARSYRLAASARRCRVSRPLAGAA